MFFNKKITSLVFAVLASSSIVFSQNYLKITTDSLEVKDAITLNSNLFFNNYFCLQPKNGSGPALKMEQSLSTLTLYGNSSFNVNKYLGGANFPSLFNIQNNGNVGIGTSNPQANLHVKGGEMIIEGKTNNIQLNGNHIANEYQSALYFKLENREDFLLSTSFVEGMGSSGSTQNFSLGYKLGAKLIFLPSSNKVKIDGDLEVKELKSSLFNTNSMRIGTTKLPTNYKLAVGGKIICEGVRVELQKNWPDYVFQPSYKLKSLEEVEQHIQQNGYLPNIPSQKDVKDNGIELGEMQRLQMEKIEELTLYLIQQNKKIESLEGQLQSLKNNK